MISVVLLMGGKGSRMNLDINKVLLPLGKKKVYQYPLDVFLNNNCEVVCVVSKDDYSILENELPKNVKITLGGDTRAKSVYNGLKCCSGDYVLIHDAARALISDEVIKNIIKMSNKNEAILTYTPVKDTIKIFENDKLTTLDRNRLIASATPQCAPFKIMLDSYEKSIKDNYTSTDDISLIEKYHSEVKINLIDGYDTSFKITTPIDYKLARLIVEELDV